jgi:hypothetical protein
MNDSQIIGALIANPTFLREMSFVHITGRKGGDTIKMVTGGRSIKMANVIQ